MGDRSRSRPAVLALTIGAVIAVPAVAGSDGNHGALVEPFRDAFRSVSFRVRQLQLGDAPFASTDDDCFINGLVTTPSAGPTVSRTVTMGGGGDRLILIETPTDETAPNSSLSLIIFVGPIPIPLFFNQPAGLICLEGIRPTGLFTVDWGAGNDVLGVVPDGVCTTGTIPERGFWRG